MYREIVAQIQYKQYNVYYKQYTMQCVIQCNTHNTKTKSGIKIVQ